MLARHTGRAPRHARGSGWPVSARGEAGPRALAERLTALDATFLELEEADQGAHMHIGGVMIFDPREDGGAPPLEAVCSHLRPRLGGLPRYRQRLSEPHTGGLQWPEWREGTGFDLAAHVSRVRLPEPGGEEELVEWASEFYSQRLDRTRPLWEVCLVEGLAGGPLGARDQDPSLHGRRRRLRGRRLRDARRLPGGLTRGGSGGQRRGRRRRLPPGPGRPRAFRRAGSSWLAAAPRRCVGPPPGPPSSRCDPSGARSRSRGARTRLGRRCTRRGRWSR